MLQANNAKTIYEELALTDVKRAAFLLDTNYIKRSIDGFISLKLTHYYVDDAAGTIEEG